MKQVSIAERALLVAVDGIVGLSHPQEVASSLRSAPDVPRKLSPTALELLQQRLSRGLGLRLLRGGAWRRLAVFDGEEARRQRPWSLGVLPELRLSPYAMQVCRSAVEALAGRSALKHRSRPASLADELVALFTAELLRRGRYRQVSPLLGRSVLVWASWPDVAAASGQSPPALKRFLEQGGVTLLRLLEPYLAGAFVETERVPARLQDRAQLLAIGDGRDAVLGQLLSHLEQSEQHEAAGFMVQAAARLTGRPASDWVGSIHEQGRLEERSEAARAGVRGLEALQRVGEWYAHLRRVGFLDEGYERAQFLLSEWNAIVGAVLHDTALEDASESFSWVSQVLGELGSLHSPTLTSSS